MADPFTVAVKGFADLDRALRELPTAVGKGVVRRALAEAAAPMVARAKALAPRDRGDLAGAIALSTRLTARQRRERRNLPGDTAAGAVELFLGAAWPEGAHAHLVEFGTAPHSIRARRAQTLARGETAFGARVEHPGARPQPFLRPAWDAEKHPTLDRFGRALWRQIERAAKRLARRAAR